MNENRVFNLSTVRSHVTKEISIEYNAARRCWESYVNGVVYDSYHATRHKCIESILTDLVGDDEWMKIGDVVYSFHEDMTGSWFDIKVPYSEVRIGNLGPCDDRAAVYEIIAYMI